MAFTCDRLHDSCRHASSQTTKRRLDHVSAAREASGSALFPSCSQTLFALSLPVSPCLLPPRHDILHVSVTLRPLNFRPRLAMEKYSQFRDKGTHTSHAHCLCRLYTRTAEADSDRNRHRALPPRPSRAVEHTVDTRVRILSRLPSTTPHLRIDRILLLTRMGTCGPCCQIYCAMADGGYTRRLVGGSPD